MNTDSPILIMAAGQSRRMGKRDKRLERIDGEPLIMRQSHMALATQHPVFVVLDLNFTGCSLPDSANIIRAPDAAEGLSASLRNAVHALPKCSSFMVILADQVKLTTSDLNAVFSARLTAPDALIWRGTTADGKPGHPIVFSAELRPKFAALTGDHGAKPIIARYLSKTQFVKLPGDHARFDLDTPQDWAAFRKR